MAREVIIHTYVLKGDILYGTPSPNLICLYIKNNIRQNNVKVLILHNVVDEVIIRRVFTKDISQTDLGHNI